MTIKEAHKKINTKSNWDRNEVKEILNELALDHVCHPKELKVGDFFFDYRVRHPNLIVEKRGDSYMVVALTSKKSPITVCRLQTRYSKDSFVYPNLSMTTLVDCAKSYMGTVELAECERVKLLAFNAFRKQ